MPTPASLWLGIRIERRLGNKNNEIALGGYDPSANGPKIAANFSAYAKPLAAGPCKQALTGSADLWDELAKADAAGDAAKLKQLGKKAIPSSDSAVRVSSSTPRFTRPFCRHSKKPRFPPNRLRSR